MIISNVEIFHKVFKQWNDDLIDYETADRLLMNIVKTLDINEKKEIISFVELAINDLEK